MDYDAIARALETATPINGHLGVKYEAVQAEKVVCSLPHDPRLGNHVGSQHAAAIFAVAEAAAGGAFVAAFGPRMAEITFVARGAQIGYTKIARGPLTATAQLALTPDLVMAEVDRDGKTRTAVEVSVADAEGEQVAEMSVAYSVRRGDPRTAPETPAEAQVG